ncbi:MAG: tRNA (adenosine(37)-N6)-dimethylallyltransferase MiaA [Dehalococcoidia bacterium]|nr:tRNA (adenosine(37)-N6)-dimethylallyltransferase MiaA [Dehalococcoidia bacterium]
MRPIVALVGPTAVGKTALALALADRFPIEIVNADSRQVYRYMDIGTSKPSVEERERVQHHVMDVVNPDEEFSLSTYLRMAKDAIEGVVLRGHIPVVVGGTGQYVWSLLEGWKVPEVPPDSEFRMTLEQMANAHGNAAVYALLERIDSVAAARIQSTNLRRVIRALELHRATGELPSELLWRKGSIPSGSVVIGLGLDRASLFARADARIDRMMVEGFVEEVKSLLAMGYSQTLPAMTSIGYREVGEHVLGLCDISTTVMKVKRETRRLIRRQHTWFRPADERILWLDNTNMSEALDSAMRMVDGVIP